MNCEKATLRASGDSIEYRDFVVQFRKDGETLVAQVVQSPAGETEEPVELADLSVTIGQIFSRFGRARSGTGGRQGGASAALQEQLQSLGKSLFDALFPDRVRDCWKESWGQVGSTPGVGLRLKIRLNLERPDLARLHDLPWEYLWDGRSFLALDRRVSIARHVDLSLPGGRPPSPWPLRILLVVSTPSNLASLPLLVDERRAIEALGRAEPGLEIVTTTAASLTALREALLAREYHILHFMGHGGFETATGKGVLYFTDSGGGAEPVTGGALAAQLRDRTSLRLVFVNACETARAGAAAPFAGIASALLTAGVPAVIAMQFPVTDRAASLFAGTVYKRLIIGDPVDAAVAEGRLAIDRSAPGRLEWGTPALFLRAPDGRVFERPSAPPLPVELRAEPSRVKPSPAQMTAPKPPSTEAPPPEPEPEPSRVTWLNLGLLAAFGLAVSVWLYVFTDTFPTVSTAWTLGGVFTCLSVLLAVAPKAVKERIIKVFQEKVLESRRTGKVVVALAVAFFLPASFRGSLSVKVSDATVCGGEKCRVTVFPENGRGRPETKEFEAEEEKTWRLPTGGIGRTYIVYAPGLPPTEVTVYPFFARERRLPEDFLLPDLVRIQIAEEYLVPEGELAQSVSFEGIGTPGDPRPYRGGVIWIGAGLPEARRLEADPRYPLDRFVSVPLPLRNGECLHVRVHGRRYGNVLLEVAKRIDLHAKGDTFALELVEPKEGVECP